jgi:hypothetical protein
VFRFLKKLTTGLQFCSRVRVSARTYSGPDGSMYGYSPDLHQVFPVGKNEYPTALCSPADRLCLPEPPLGRVLAKEMQFALTEWQNVFSKGGTLFSAA